MAPQHTSEASAVAMPHVSENPADSAEKDIFGTVVCNA